MNTSELMGHALLLAQEGRLMLARLLGQSLVNGAKRLRSMGRTYIEPSERAAVAELRTRC